ncbi:DUF1622 domain-containing protein [Fodinicurvata sp. EGI_FJ10296]|uniref:DUF1622 domain-containing protein n=1 Tax=Fodinicurvata sp. EGI_FJ10296 TaxID=3231908 RepID=UPI003455CEF4
MLLYDAIEIVRHIINAIGAAIVLWGVVEAAVRFVHVRFRPTDGLTYGIQRVRERLGIHLLLALDIFIGADILGTVAHPNWTGLGILAGIVVIRIVLSFLLTREIQETHEVLRERDENLGRDVAE